MIRWHDLAVLSFAAVILSAQTVAAQRIYRCVDAEGTVSFEYVPEGQTVENWREMITLQGFRDADRNPALTPKNFLGLKALDHRKVCGERMVAISIGDLRVDGHDAHAAIIGCGSVPADRPYGLKQGVSNETPSPRKCVDADNQAPPGPSSTPAAEKGETATAPNSSERFVSATAAAPPRRSGQIATVPIFSQTLAFTVPAGWKLGFENAGEIIHIVARARSRTTSRYAAARTCISYTARCAGRSLIPGRPRSHPRTAAS